MTCKYEGKKALVEGKRGTEEVVRCERDGKYARPTDCQQCTKKEERDAESSV